MDASVLRKRIYKLLTFSVLMVFSILLMAFLFINHTDDSLNKATYATMNQEIDLCKQRISSKKNTDLVLLNTFARNLNMETDLNSSLLEMKKESDFSSIQFIDMNHNVYSSEKNSKLLYNDLSDEYKDKIKSGFEGKQSAFKEKNNDRLTYITPVYEDANQIVGVLCADSGLQPYMDLMKKSISGGNLYVTDLKDFYGIQKDSESNEVLAVLKNMGLSEKVSGLIGVKGQEHGIVVKKTEIQGWYLCYVNSAKSLNYSMYVMSRTTNYVLMLFVIVVILLLWIAYRMMVKNNDEMEKLAYTDQLTGAVSFARFTQLVRMYAHKNNDYSLVSLNLRRFKFMNEILGRDKSDDFLCRIVTCIKPMLKKDEIICRDSADVFYMLLIGTDENVISNRIHAIFNSIRQNTKDFCYEYEFCCGVISNSTYSFEQMLTNVMFALAQSKEMASENICFFDEEVHKKKEFENFVESNMQQALDSNCFEMVLQPKVDLDTNLVVSSEALVRWKLEDGTCLPPSSFVGIFEKNRFCSKLDFYMLRKAIQQIRKWIDMGIQPVNISVNQSKIVFYHENYITELQSLLREYDVSASYITLEVLESTVIEDFKLFNQILSEVKKLGFSVSLDDFGSGYSSLNVLSKLDIDELKIDRIFLHTDSELENKKTKWILEAIINIAKKSNIRVVVEGVESIEDDRFIRCIGANVGQGYYYSRPLAIDAFNDLIHKK
ncbi:GGDEF domain-containing protein [uncultured Holdemanella sp.]|uniref:GGDEF domain-containing protein n=1 Tax=uncultured Holdemanella sp. TaxID=1763549 RepID=UPI0025ED4432|nr:GGDEF domain-containing protein [uncultured Holdemanella sp.]